MPIAGNVTNAVVIAVFVIALIAAVLNSAILLVAEATLAVALAATTRWISTFIAVMTKLESDEETKRSERNRAGLDPNSN